MKLAHAERRVRGVNVDIDPASYHVYASRSFGAPASHLLRTDAELALSVFPEANAIFPVKHHTVYPPNDSANWLATAHLRQGKYPQAAHTHIPASNSGSLCFMHFV